MSYVIIKYKPTNLFSLKTSESTSSGAMSLFVPSFYCIKMSLLNSICVYENVACAKEKFDLIKNLDLKIKIPESFVVNNCFIKILKLDDKAPKPFNRLFKSSIAFREYLFLKGSLEIGFDKKNFSQTEISFIIKQFSRINYFGKRSCFFQYFGNEKVENINESFLKDFNPKSDIINLTGTLQSLDDFFEDEKFDAINTYSETKLKKKRKKRIIVMPVFQNRANKNYTYYTTVK
jgi:hypothetical protein